MVAGLPVSLDDKYRFTDGRVFLSGTQALVRLPLVQRARDRAAGLNTGGFISRLPRLAARRLRPGAVAGEEAARRREHRLPARPQRGARRDRGLGHAARRPAPRRDGRWRVRHLVRQGPGPRPRDGRRSSTPTPPVRRRTAGCSPSSATTMAPSRPPCPTRPTTISRRRSSRSSPPPASTSSSNTACSASP